MNRKFENRRERFDLEEINRTEKSEVITVKSGNVRKWMLAGLLMIAFIGFSAAQEKKDSPKYFYDSKGAIALAEYQTVCVLDENGLYLLPRVKYFFDYDANDNVIKKKTLMWDETKRDWVNSKLYKFTYSNHTVVLDFAKWNKQEGDYDEFSERIIYNVESDMLTSCSFYTRDSSGEYWNLDFSHSVNLPVSTLWNGKQVLLADVDNKND